MAQSKFSLVKNNQRVLLLLSSPAVSLTIRSVCVSEKKKEKRMPTQSAEWLLDIILERSFHLFFFLGYIGKSVTEREREYPAHPSKQLQLLEHPPTLLFVIFRDRVDRNAIAELTEK